MDGADPMLTEAFATLSPRLAARYQAVLTRALRDSPELAALHTHYLDYTRLDTKLPRPVLAYFGHHATTQDVSFGDLDTIGDGLLIAQLVRDFLAIHDDIVDEDLDKFGTAPLSVRLSGQGMRKLTHHGKDLALYYGDFLIGERKAAHYCYAFPFALGATLAGHPPDVIDPVVSTLLAVGTLSQVVDDLTGAFPGVIDNDKDTLGEIANLRRTLPLVLLAHNTARIDIIELLSAPTPLDENDARQLREYLWKSDVPQLALTLCQDKLTQIQTIVNTLPIGTATATYLSDLVQHRLSTKINHFRAALAPQAVREEQWAPEGSPSALDGQVDVGDRGPVGCALDRQVRCVRPVQCDPVGDHEHG